MACGAANGQGYIWSIATGKKVWRGDTKDRFGQVIAFAPDGKQFVTIASKDELTFWDVASLKPVGRISACTTDIVKLSPDGKTLVLFEFELERLHGVIGFWDAATKRRVAKAEWRGGFSYNPTGSYVADFSPDGRLLAWTEGGNQIHLTEVASGKDAAVSRTSQREIMALAFSPDGGSLAFEENDSRFIPMWSLASRTVTRKLAKKGREISSPLTFSPRENFLATNGSHADTLCLWDLRNGKRTPLIGAEVDEDLGRLTGLVFSPDGSMLIAGFNDRGGVCFWDMKANRLSRRFRTLDSITAMAISPDGNYLAVVGVQKVIRVRNLKTNKEIYRLAGHTEEVASLAFSPDGRTLASGGEDKEIRLWEMASGKPCLRITTAAKLTSLAFSRDGRYLASGGHTPDISLWNLATGDEAATLQGHLGDVSALAFSPDGKTLASGSLDTTILLWHWRTMLKPKGKPVFRPSASELEHRWNDLASNNTTTAHRAIWTLAQAPEAALALIRAHLRPVPSPKPGQIARLIADLDSIDFSTRKQASLELAALGELAEPELRQTLRKKGPLELRRRVKILLDRVDRRILSASDLRNLRALAVLEHSATRASMDFLKELAGGASGARLTKEAQDTLARLRHLK